MTGEDSAWILSCLKYIHDTSKMDLGYIILLVFFILIVAIGVIAIVSVCKGNTFKLWIIHIEPSVKIKGLREAFDKLERSFQQLNTETKQRNAWLRLQAGIVDGLLIIEQNSKSLEEFNDNFNMLLEFALPSAISILTGGKEDVVRAAVLVPEGEHLKILNGYGYSVKGKANLRLKKTDIAGQVFTLGLEQYIPNVNKNEHWTRNPKASKNYTTLSCIPILLGDRCCGVLNIDAEQEDAFNKDERNALGLIAKSLAIAFCIRENIQEDEGRIERRGKIGQM